MTIRIAELDCKSLAIPFRAPFRHAAASRATTSSLWVRVVSDDGQFGFGESCPRPYVTNETLDGARAFFLRHRNELMHSLHDLDDLRRWTTAHRELIDVNPSAWCAIELGFFDLFGRITQQPLEALLSLPPLHGEFHYSAVIGDGDSGQFTRFLHAYLKNGMTDFKIKISGDPVRDLDKFQALRGVREPSLRVRVDANNVWSDADTATGQLRAFDFPLFAVEEPLRSHSIPGMREIAKSLEVPIVLDESVSRVDQLDALAADPERWIVNVRVSKMGGVLRSLDIAQRARSLGIPIIVGAQVGETSVLTRAALAVAHANRNDYLALEGAFGTNLLDHDIYIPSLSFGRNGVLDVTQWPALSQPGFGLQCIANPSDFVDDF